ncbi:unnamed protein product [Linum trigynum]|uniref:C2 domain-containing protein n=1 Tax=Linum trigynum TaxID=586398 RepID=A0AAV2DPA0_9ROSI
MEITIISAQGLKNMSKTLLPFSNHCRLRPFVAISTYPKMAPPVGEDSSTSKSHITRIDDRGGVNPTWGDKFYIPVDAAFLGNRCSCIYLELYTKRLFSGRAQLGWCQIPVADFGFSPSPGGMVRYLSYRVMDHRDGTRGQGVLNIAVRLTGGGLTAQRPPPPGESVESDQKVARSCQGTVIGIPVEMFSNMRICQ